RQIADIEHELPDLSLRHAPGWHAGVPDAVTDVIEEFAVRHRRDECAKSRGTRILAGADLAFATAVVAMADFAFLPEQITAGCDICDIGAERISLLARRVRHAMAQQPGGHCNLDLGG